MWAVLLEWIAILEDEETYGVVQEFLKSDLQGVTECAWFLRAYEEALFMSHMRCSWQGKECIGCRTDLADLIKNMNFILNSISRKNSHMKPIVLTL